MAWRVEILDVRVQRELEALPVEVRAKFVRISELLVEFGPEIVREPYVKHLEGRLWEMRMKARGTSARAIYVVAVGKRLVVVHVFAKKSQKTPRAALAVARQRAKEVT